MSEKELELSCEEEFEDVVDGEETLFREVRIVADRGQSPIRIDKFLIDHLAKYLAKQDTTGCRCRLNLGQRQGCQEQLQGKAT